MGAPARAGRTFPADRPISSVVTVPLVVSRATAAFPRAAWWLELSGLPRNSTVSPHAGARRVSPRAPTSAGLTAALKLTTSAARQQGNFSDTSSFKSRRSKGSIGHAFTVCIRTENQNQMSVYPFVPHEISVLVELILGHLRYLLTDVPPQPNSPPDNVFHLDRRAGEPAALDLEGGTSPASRPWNK